MTYRSLLVFLDRDPHYTARTQIAMRLARELDCHLVGLAPTGVLDLQLLAEAGPSLTQLADLGLDTLRQRAGQAAEQFSDDCRAAGLKSFEAVVDEADRALSLVRHAHCSDLTVLTQADPASPGHSFAQAVVEQVVLYSARPTLIIPYAGRFDSIGSNVMVAWDDSREAARALADALPLLRHARQVQVVSWAKASKINDEAQRPSLDALKQWLMWQGVMAEVRIESTEIGIGDAMLSRAADLGADLIVMGAYGHARWAERVLGGATHELLAAMTVPVLMSH